MEPPAGSSKQTRSGATNDQVESKHAPEIVFITSDASGSKESRQAIRRQAAQHSHRVGRKKPQTKKQKLEQEEQGKLIGQSCVPLRLDLPALVLPFREVDGDSSFTGSNSETGCSPRSTPISSDPDIDEFVVQYKNEGQLQLRKSQVSSMILRHTLMDRDSMTTNTYPVPVVSWYPRLLEYMWEWMGQSWKAMDTTADERASALSWVQCVTMSEPCYFYMNMLSVADTLHDHNMIESWKTLWLKGQVVKSINSALSDPARMQSAGVVLAVGRIALEEIVSGDKETGERFHRPAQAKLIAMAGGLEALELPSLVFKHVCWADRVMTRITDTSMVKLNSEVRSDPRPRYNPQPVDMDLELLNRYRPQRTRKHGAI